MTAIGPVGRGKGRCPLARREAALGAVHSSRPARPAPTLAPRSLSLSGPVPIAVPRRTEEPQQLHRQGHNIPPGTGRRAGRGPAGRPRWGVRVRVRPAQITAPPWGRLRCPLAATPSMLEVQQRTHAAKRDGGACHGILGRVCVPAGTWPDPRCSRCAVLGHLRSLVNLLEQYYHPSNSGRCADRNGMRGVGARVRACVRARPVCANRLLANRLLTEGSSGARVTALAPGRPMPVRSAVPARDPQAGSRAGLPLASALAPARRSVSLVLLRVFF